MADLLSLSAVEARAALDAGEVSAPELTGAYLAAIEETGALNNYVAVTADKAMEMAEASQARIKAGEAGLIEGIPVGVKDLFCTAGVASTACSKILEGFTPTYESTVTANLWREGGVMLGKINCDEFAMGSANETSAFGPAVNPWQAADGADLVPGGSSGGSASAVAARSALLATGTDTGGSIRQPAAFCGVVGMKPTYGRCSRWGIVAFASSLDQAGPFSRTVADNALMMQAMASHDLKDSTSADTPLPDLMAALDKGVKGMKIGVPSEYVMDGMDSEVVALWEKGQAWLRDAGAELVEISLPHTKYALPAYYIIAPAEASSNLARYDGVRYGLRVEADSLDDMYGETRAAGFGDEVQRRIMIGTYVLSAGYYDAYYLKAQKVRRLIKQDFDTAYETVDAILTPATPTAAFPVGRKVDDPVTNFLNDVFTVPANLAGLPGMAVPAGLNAEGLPLGLQILGRPFDEATLYSIGRVIEDAAAFDAVPSRRAGGAS
ncbi:MAG: Asp-tRNA(Asn)/Glu-tRNA(Gln) amidotransferase GatCAB subunit A [SAR116 cluster bacterium]|jgi:aspartyl-tRNA(Asn)/glutamyl-tRNA(Gln) amidotransferase subunit A|nr:Asp-tRNA(Asn)/Glu-tRNA(Gln) amidotransferase GatCAB subunit A [SAR116 cluster bacterium]MEC7171775.1 Asp-tRNA(Asn)/Glu-tRNA(Gln) amidotransferase subunit GatA [Pseudomonadota bacterium]MEE3091246.1 Asp-tRNA(Asn)/Glu-tRNA(Gln) amidotransferase subunit GatA [Pseudomonadota bacterium]